MSISADYILSRSPSASPPVPRRASPVITKTCPMASTSTTPHIPHHPLPPMPLIHLSQVQKKKVVWDSNLAEGSNQSDQPCVPELSDESLCRPLINKHIGDDFHA